MTAKDFSYCLINLNRKRHLALDDYDDDDYSDTEWVYFQNHCRTAIVSEFIIIVVNIKPIYTQYQLIFCVLLLKKKNFIYGNNIKLTNTHQYVFVWNPVPCSCD